FPEQLLEAVVAEADVYAGVIEHDDGTADQSGILLEQQRPLRIASRILALRQQIAPSGGRLVDQLLPAAQLPRPFFQRRGWNRIGTEIHERVRHAEPIQPIAGLAAGIAGGEAENRGAHSQSRSRSLMDVFVRVFSSTRLTITAAYRLCEPSNAGNEPATTTLPAGMRP